MSDFTNWSYFLRITWRLFDVAAPAEQVPTRGCGFNIDQWSLVLSGPGACCAWSRARPLDTLLSRTPFCHSGRTQTIEVLAIAYVLISLEMVGLVLLIAPCEPHKSQ